MKSPSFNLVCYLASALIILLAGPPEGKDNYFILIPLLGPLIVGSLGNVSPIFDSSLASLSIAAVYEAGTPVEMSLFPGIILFVGVSLAIVTAYEVTNRPSLVSTVFLAIVIYLYGDFQGSWWRVVATIAIVATNYMMLRLSTSMPVEQRHSFTNTVRLIIFIISVDMVLKGVLQVSCGYLLALPNVIWLFTVM